MSDNEKSIREEERKRREEQIKRAEELRRIEEERARLNAINEQLRRGKPRDERPEEDD